MPHLYLPSDHTDADLVLAADVAAAVSSADLYVTWTLEAGAGTPDVEAVVREETAPHSDNPFMDLLAAIGHGIAALWAHLTGPPAAQHAHAHAGGATRRREPSL
jgi:hypothetical protein